MMLKRKSGKTMLIGNFIQLEGVLKTKTRYHVFQVITNNTHTHQEKIRQLKSYKLQPENPLSYKFVSLILKNISSGITGFIRNNWSGTETKKYLSVQKRIFISYVGQQRQVYVYYAILTYIYTCIQIYKYKINIHRYVP